MEALEGGGVCIEAAYWTDCLTAARRASSSNPRPASMDFDVRDRFGVESGWETGAGEVAWSEVESVGNRKEEAEPNFWGVRRNSGLEA